MSYGASITTKLSEALADHHLSSDEVDDLLFAPDVQSKADFDKIAEAATKVSVTPVSTTDTFTIDNSASVERLRTFVSVGYQPYVAPPGPTPPPPSSALGRCGKGAVIGAVVAYVGGAIVGSPGGPLSSLAYGSLAFWPGAALGCAIGVIDP